MYAASKAGIVCKLFRSLVSEYLAKISEAFSRALAEEYGRLGIRVNTLVPGFIDTDMIEDGVGKTEIPFIYITHQSSNKTIAGEFYIQGEVEYMLTVCQLWKTRSQFLKPFLISDLALPKRLPMLQHSSLPTNMQTIVSLI